MPRSASRVVLFDLNGTLTDPSAMGGPWNLPELGAEALAGAIQSAMVETILGRYRPFREHLESGLRGRVRERGLDETRVEEAMEISAALPPFADTPGALETMRTAGYRLAVLTNSGADAGRRTLAAAGLAESFERILGVDAVEKFKPHPATYAYALHELGAKPGEVTFVAAHAWDLAGAADAGMQTALVRRDGGSPPVYPPPEIESDELSGIAAALGS